MKITISLALRATAALALFTAGPAFLTGCEGAPESVGDGESLPVGAMSESSVAQAVVSAPAAPVTASLAAARDTSIRFIGGANVNYGRETTLDINRTLVAVDQAALAGSLGPTDYLLSARLELTLTSNNLRRLSPTKVVDAHRLTKAWTETGATWFCAIDSNTGNKKADCSGATAWSMGPLPPNPFVATPTASATIRPAQTGVITLDVTADVRAMARGQLANHGWMLRSGWLGEFAEFASRESATPPRLVLSIRRCSAQLCDDGNACTVESCDAVAACVHDNAADGTSCSDGNACTAVDACLAGACRPGPQDVCAPPPIVINEVESNGGVPGDWVELYNAGTQVVDLSNWVFKDNDDTHSYKLPVGTTIAPGGYVVIEEAAFGFGLGGAESARIYDGGLRLIDSHVWTAHAAVTYGRCPNGSGPFASNTTSTKGATNDCSSPPGTGGAGGAGGTGGAGGAGGAGGGGGSPVVRITEVESNGGVPGDWVELYNPGTAPVNLTGTIFKDADDTHNYVLPAGSVVAAGGYLVLEEAAFGFGLGGAESARLYDATGMTIIDSYAWTAHAPITYGRCPTPSGSFTSNATSTKGAANDCNTFGSGNIVVNEVESSGGVPGDWIELYNKGTTTIDVSGWVVKDADDSHVSTIPAGTTIAAGAYYIVEEAQLGFGLGTPDAVRVFDINGALVSSYNWTPHAPTSYGRCPNGTGDFVTTGSVTKAATNDCGTPPGTGGAGGAGGTGGTGGAGGAGGIAFAPWPGGNEVTEVDEVAAFTSNLSGLTYEPATGSAPAVLWAVQNGPSLLHRLVWNGTTWAGTTTDGWAAGKTLTYPGFPVNTGAPDTESVTKAEMDSPAIYVATERDNNANTISRMTVLRYDTSASGSTLVATHEWNLTADLPVMGQNLGLEAITWVPDSYLTTAGFFDASKNKTYSPADYPGHGTGLFFVGIEGNGNIYVYALDHTGGTSTRITSFSAGLMSLTSPFPAAVMGIEFDRDLGRLWASCDNTCGNRSTVFAVSAGQFTLLGGFEPPTGFAATMNNEGIAFAPTSECVAGRRSFFWADDGDTGTRSLRQGTLSCGPVP